MQKYLLVLLILSCFSFGSCKKEKQPTACFTSELWSIYSQSYTFDNCSTNADHYMWDMGDGNKSFEFEPTRSGNNYWYYTSPGTYTITLTAYSASENITDVASQTIIVQ